MCYAGGAGLLGNVDGEGLFIIEDEAVQWRSVADGEGGYTELWRKEQATNGRGILVPPNPVALWESVRNKSASLFALRVEGEGVMEFTTTSLHKPTGQLAQAVENIERCGTY